MSQNASIVPDYSDSGGGGVSSIGAGTGITITGTPTNPIINSQGAIVRPSFTIYVAPNGDDTTGDGSMGLPFQTPQAAINFRATLNLGLNVEIFCFPANYVGPINVTTINTYFNTNPSQYRDQKNVIFSGIITISPSTTVGVPSEVGFQNILFFQSLSATTTQTPPNYVFFTDCSFISCPISLNIGSALLTTLFLFADCYITNNTATASITNTGGYLKVIRCEFITGSAANNAIINTGVGPRFDLQYCHFLNTANSTSLSPFVSYQNTGASTQNYIMYNTFQFINTATDIAGNKGAIQYNHTGSVIEQNVTGNTFIYVGGTYALRKPGAGTVTITAYGGNFGTNAVNRDPSITVTNMLVNS
jgi:hypothetical protein